MDYEYQLFGFNHPNKERIEVLQLILTDLRHAVQCLEIATEMSGSNNGNHIVSMALEFQALVSYYRCFGSGRRAALRHDDVFANQPHLKDDHLYFRDLRDKHIAHPVIKTEHNELVLAAKSREHRPVGIGNFFFKFAGFGTDDFKRLMELMQHVVVHTELDEKRLCDELARDLFGDSMSWSEACENFHRVVVQEQLYSPMHKSTDS